jgi:acetyl-CoA acetyltransferase
VTHAWLIGVGSTPFARWPARGFRDLATEAVEATLTDAGLEDGRAVEQIWFGNCAMGTWGQANIRGQVALGELQRSGRLAAQAPVVNVEGGCATGSAALHGAIKDVLSGQSDLSLAVGVEKTYVAHDPSKILELFLGGIDQLHPEEWKAFLPAAAEQAGVPFAPHPHRILFIDVHAMQAAWHMKTYGTTREQLAHVASKNHGHGALNPKAQLRAPLTPEQVLADKEIVAPFTRAMCAPISDGAAAALVCSDRFLAGLDPSIRDRAIRVCASELVSGTWRHLHEPNVLAHAARKAYKRAGIQPAQVDLAEVHDASAFCELQATELLGFCAPGEGGAYATSGATGLQGERPVNTSGGLVSKGHPLGATGLGMIEELVTQLRREAGPRQVRREAEIAVQHNAGGMIGVDEALCSVVVLARS